MIGNPWKRLRESEAACASLSDELARTRSTLAQVALHSIQQGKIIAALSARQGIDPDTIQADDTGTVRYIVPEVSSVN
jgi:hypothetical protein